MFNCIRKSLDPWLDPIKYVHTCGHTYTNEICRNNDDDYDNNNNNNNNQNHVHHLHIHAVRLKCACLSMCMYVSTSHLYQKNKQLTKHNDQWRQKKTRKATDQE